MKTDLREFLKNSPFTILDGAFGTNVLIKYPENYDSIELFNFRDEDLVFDIHKSYVDAGSDIISANTFSANRFKLKPKGYSVDAVVEKALSIARRAGAKYAALDIGPLGGLLKPFGDMTFSDAYDAFREIVLAGARHGADLVYFETFSDLSELKIGVLAAKENTDLPVFATMTFEANNKTFIGVSAAAAALTLDGLGIDAFGLNCSSGPAAMLPIVEEIAAHTNLPIIAKANAGIPEFTDGKSVYGMTPEEFARSLESLIDAGATLVGGCCGTDARFIREIKSLLSRKKPAVRDENKGTFLASRSRVVSIDDNFTVIGERLNPTGKPALKKALIERDAEFLIAEARAQLKAGADVIDINSGIFEVDERKTLTFIAETFNGVIDAPFCLDSSEPEALESAARITGGLPLINSVNGKTENLDAVMPVAKKYGAPLICLLLDENGIPKTVGDRIRVAEKIIAFADRYGIKRKKLVFDCLTLTASAEQENVVNTLKAVRVIREKFDCNTVLGLSNVSFGLPARARVNAAFLSHALAHGLTSAILNPLDGEVMGAVDAYRVLYNKDKNSEKYIAKYKNAAKPNQADLAYGNVNFATNNTADSAVENAGFNANGNINFGESADGAHPLIGAIIKGAKDETYRIASALIQSEDGLSLINKYLIPALDAVGSMYEKGEIFLPELLTSANAAKAAFDVVREKSPKAAEVKGTVLLATVFGDVHDIGKNIAKMLLNNYGYDVIDLGKDVPVDLILKTVKENDIRLVGLSALMTTTLNNMRDTIAAIRRISDAKIMVGGAVVTKENSSLIGADYYCKDALDGVSVAKKLL
ncbi:MAG: homocysteine S-methyltransferase family protein [Clostridiales bacterium]|jgi:5-methyltetrahydrofolate--homocysteine methyltransferase|nr:homocysteine S-methyltransferase family protein [Clostridiales bacterium]